MPGLDLDRSQHGWLGRYLKRAVASLVRYHSYHQERVNSILATSIGYLGARLDGLIARLAALSDEDERARAEQADEAAARLGELGVKLADLRRQLAEAEDELQGSRAPLARAKDDMA